MYNIHMIAFIILLLVLLVAISVLRNDKDIDEIEDDIEGKKKKRK